MGEYGLATIQKVQILLVGTLTPDILKLVHHWTVNLEMMLVGCSRMKTSRIMWNQEYLDKASYSVNASEKFGRAPCSPIQSYVGNKVYL